MRTLGILRLDGSRADLDEASLTGLASRIRGRVLRSGDAGYDEARSIWNAMIDRRPALIVRCTGAGDVLRAVAFARDRSLLVSIRGGGHNIAGSAVCDGGVMIDLSLMKYVRIDPKERTAQVGPGATLADFDHEAQVFGLATPVGINSTTGIAGLTLGAGFGWLSRKHGMTIDNLRECDVVTADGKFVRASENENADLFWALRGGGGNFGVVTRFEFGLHRVGPEVLAGLVVYPIAQAGEVLRKYRDFVDGLGNETSVWAVLRKAPPLPFLPENVHGTEVVVLAVFHAGDPAVGERILDPVRRFGKPVGEHVGVQPYTAWQSAFDPLLTPGARNYWKSHNFSTLPDAAIDVAVDYTRRLPSSQCEIFFGLIGGATKDKAPGAMAYAHRDATYVMNVHGRWDRPEEDAAGVSWARAFFKDTAPYATGGVYVNFLTDDETDRIAAAYGPNHERLAKLKAKFDPQNLFRANQNVKPAS